VPVALANSLASARLFLDEFCSNYNSNAICNECDVTMTLRQNTALNFPFGPVENVQLRENLHIKAQEFL